MSAGLATRFWVDDERPVSGRLRTTVYLGLLFFAFIDVKSPLLGIVLYEATDAGWYSSHGLAGLLGLSWMAPELLRWVVYALVPLWLCAGLGLFFRVTSVLTAAGVVFLHAVLLSTSAMNHAWYLTMYTLIALCFSRHVDAYSLDHKWRKKEPSAPMSSLMTSGFCRKLALIAAVGFYFSAGISKLTLGGVAWMDGKTLQHALERKSDLALFGPLLSKQLWLCSVVSVVSFVLELGAPLALWKRARLPFVVGWGAMHLGIRATLGVHYFANCWCLVLLVDWEGLVARLRNIELPVAAPPAVPRALASLWLLPAIWLGVAVGHVEWWPFTAVDMYSAYNTAKWKGGRPWWHYRHLPRVQELARQCRAGGCNRHTREIIGESAQFRLVGPGTFRVMRVGPGSHSRKHWVRMVVTPVVIEDIATKPDGALGGAQEGAAARFLERALPILRRWEPGWELYDRVELAFPLDGREVVLASVPLK